MLEKICKAELSDLQDIAALESEIFSDAWSLKSLEETWNQKNAVIFAAKTEEKIAGYLIIYYVLDEGEIARIATARRFYEKCGFTEDGIRKNYYENPQENAILMSKSLQETMVILTALSTGQHTDGKL